MIIKVAYTVSVDKEFIDDAMEKYSWIGADEREAIRKLLATQGLKVANEISGTMHVINEYRR